MEVEGMGINSNFLVGSIIEKLPQSWKNFKLYLKHLTDDMSFEQLVLKIHVKEDYKINEKADANSIKPNANMIAESSSKSKSNHKNKGKNGSGSGQKYSKDGKKDYTQQKNNNFKKVYHCWVCGKPRHKAKDCYHKKEHGGKNSGGNSNQANHVRSLEMDIKQKDKKEAKNNKAKHGMKKTKSNQCQSQSKSKDSQVEEIQLEGLKLPNLKLY
ncbi:DNA polymerase zeta catalytic subunit-like protein [Tanacetum coccineum]|uniref:DNA polymerase zeta catalytic subunit-like protein n=1 Tax=Tanacetum coccineum TaxID=301880 RepID=A0ABQ4Y4H5_9ASTR